MKTSCFKISVFGIVSSLLLLLPLQSSGAVLAYERFDYPDGPEDNPVYANGLNGGGGWDGTWVLETNNPARINGTIKNGQLVAAQQDVSMYRKVDLNLSENKIIYLMVDMANVSSSDYTFSIGFNKATDRASQVIHIGKGNTATNIGIRYRKSSTNWYYPSNTADRIPMGSTMQRLVLAVDQLAGEVRFYVNPDVTTSEETWDLYYSATDLLSTEWLAADSLWIDVRGGSRETFSLYPRVIDNIVIATTWEDLAGIDVIPEPGVAVLTLLGGVALFGLQRRRRHRA